MEETNQEPKQVVQPQIAPEQVTTPQVQVPAQAVIEHAHKNIFIVIGIFLAVCGVVLGSFFIQDLKEGSQSDVVLNYDRPVNPNPAEPNPPPIVTPTQTPSFDGTFTNWVNVEWNPNLDEVMGDDCDIESYNKGLDCDYARNFKVGKVLDGTYQGKDLFLNQAQGMGTYYQHYVITEDGTRTNLHDTKTGIHKIDDTPELIDFPLKSGYKMEKGQRHFKMFSDIKIVRLLFSHPVLGDFYLADDGCIVVKLPDHTTQSYNFDYSFIDNEKDFITAQINGKSLIDSYSFWVPSCGAGCFYWTIKKEEELNPTTRLQLSGEMANGEDIYLLKDSNDKVLKDLYNDKNSVAYTTDTSGGTGSVSKYTYEQFLQLNPLFYWKDPLGRWIEFKNFKVLPAAEMCKPVIYLYPEKPSNIQVQVQPNGGFTYTEPAYNNGWNVLALPNGKLFDLTSLKSYDYLFWEGLGLEYPIQDKGFVVEQSQLENFFNDKLVKLGLNAKESADFKEYWLGRLTDKPYYKISFVRKFEFDQIAPLTVSDNPDTVIRVMMTASALDAFEEMEPQIFDRTPARNGFVVAEWGGALLK